MNRLCSPVRIADRSHRGTPSPTDVQSPSGGAVKLLTGSLVPGTTYFIDDTCCV
jgi:hypothetical protein